MRIVILGSGTGVPSLRRSSSSLLLLIADRVLLFDLGLGTIKRLLEAGFTISQVTHLFFTHFHPDHTGEFVSFLFATKYPPTYSRRTPFKVIAARGVRKFYERLREAYGEWIELDPELLDFIEVDPWEWDQFSDEFFTVDTFPMLHSESSIGYRVTEFNGTSAAITGDTDMCENAISLAKNVDVLICESALPDALKVEGHLTPSQAGSIATQSGARRLVLTHFYPECDAVDVEAECRKTYQGPLVLAQDLMRFDVP